MLSWTIIAGVALLPLGLPAVAQAAPLVDSAVQVPLSTTTVRLAVEHAFPNDPTMVRIAQCESRFRQFDANGRVLAGGIDPDDTGTFQINKRYHIVQADKMVLDINTLEGNIAYAKYLRKKNGYKDWLASKKCWEVHNIATVLPPTGVPLK